MCSKRAVVLAKLIDKKKKIKKQASFSMYEFPFSENEYPFPLIPSDIGVFNF